VIGAVLALVLLVGIAVILGPYRIAPANLIAFLIAKLTGAASPLPASAEAVILQIRLPRIFAAMAIGAALAASGAAYQSLFRNPRHPYTEGLLSSFPGLHGVREALAAGVKVSGCSVILVDSGVDSGPILAQQAVPVLDDDDEESLHERIKIIERTLVVDTVGRMVREGWSVQGRTVRIGS